MLQYMVTISASPQSSCFHGYCKSGKYYSFYKRVVKYMNTFDNELVIEPQINGNPHCHILFKTAETIENLKLFFEQFYPYICNPYSSDKVIWTLKTNPRYPECTEYYYTYGIKIQQNFSNESDYMNKKKDNGYQEAAYQWHQELKKISKSEYYKVFEKCSKTSKFTKNQLYNNFDSYDYDKIKDFIDDNPFNFYETCEKKCHITHINTPNQFPSDRINKSCRKEYLEFLN